MLPKLCRLVSAGALALAVAVAARAVTLKVNVTPAGATVTTEDGQHHPTPASLDLKRRDEPYTFVIEKAGYQTESVTYFTKQKLKELAVTLEPLQIQRDITIRSVPDGATLTIDGQAAGVAPLTKSATFSRDSKTSPWKPLAVTMSLADYQSESFELPYDAPAPDAVALGRLRRERIFSVETKASDGSPI
ncbi:MAG TPA: PEGA domain-containing protein, partial [Thermoanaerobaculia bacterium]